MAPTPLLPTKAIFKRRAERHPCSPPYHTATSAQPEEDPDGRARSPTWEETFAALCRWRAANGSCLVPKSSGSLGRWTSRQRELYKSGKLDPSRCRALAEIGFVFDIAEVRFASRLRNLEKYVRENGHARVPSSHPDGLGLWVAKTRKRYHRNLLPDDRIRRLERLGFVWSPGESEWLARYQELAEYKEKHGTCSVRAQSPGWERLAWWVAAQRKRRRQGKLSAARTQKLDLIAFTWEPQEHTFGHVSQHINTRPSQQVVDSDEGSPPSYQGGDRSSMERSTHSGATTVMNENDRHSVERLPMPGFSLSSLLDGVVFKPVRLGARNGPIL